MGALERVTLGELPEGGERVWLDDAPGSRGVADTWAFWAELHGLDVELVLTGRAVDGSHPRVGCTETMEDAGPVVCAPCEVVFERVESADALRGADTLRGLAQLEALEEVDPEAGRWSWFELRRLRQIGRGAEIPELLPTLAARGVDRARALLELVRFYRYVDLEEAEAFAQLAEEIASDASVAADAAFLRQWIRRTMGLPAALPEPAGAALRAMWRLDRGELTDATASSDFERALCADRASPGRGADLWVRRGQLSSATRSVHRTGGPPALVRRYAEYARILQEAEDLERMVREAPDTLTLDRVEAAVPTLALGGVAGFLVAGKASLQLRDPVSVALWSSRLARVLPFHAVEELLPELPVLDASSPVWAAIRWAEAFHVREELHTRLVEEVAKLAPRPLVAGDYALHAPLAAGAMGEVWRAEHVLTGRPVAAKVLRDGSPRAVAAFSREIDLAAGLEHPHIVPVLDRAEVGPLAAVHACGRLEVGQQVLVMELVTGGSLQEHLGDLPWTRCAEVLEQLLDALRYVHARGLVHRDVKPANVLLDASGGARLVDFGLAHAASGRVAGTPTYMA
ncbi:MAG: serine/threonine protein kinase, partial [Myxococcales bacterium]|nr:serine/threonine protein kinase [Myxococcales bacterium]